MSRLTKTLALASVAGICALVGSTAGPGTPLNGVCALVATACAVACWWQFWRAINEI